MNKNLEKITLNLLYHKKKKVYILRTYDGVHIFDDNNSYIKSYYKENAKGLIRQLKLEELLD